MSTTQCIEATKGKFTIRLGSRDETWNSIVFYLSVIPLESTPRRIVFLSRYKKKPLSMSWRKFLKQTCFRGTNDDSIVIIPKSELD